jgi:hypothetical protein
MRSIGYGAKRGGRGEDASESRKLFPSPAFANFVRSAPSPQRGEGNESAAIRPFWSGHDERGESPPCDEN